MRFFDLQAFQKEHARWLAHNFPKQKPHEPLLGLAEEVGELAHAHLKHDQGIRGYDAYQWRKEAMDAVGDIVVYLASYCNANGLDLEACVMTAWEEVKERDWREFPDTGRPSNAEQSSG